MSLFCWRVPPQVQLHAQLLHVHAQDACVLVAQVGVDAEGRYTWPPLDESQEATQARCPRDLTVRTHREVVGPDDVRAVDESRVRFGVAPVCVDGRVLGKLAASGRRKCCHRVIHREARALRAPVLIWRARACVAPCHIGDQAAKHRCCAPRLFVVHVSMATDTLWRVSGLSGAMDRAEDAPPLSNSGPRASAPSATTRAVLRQYHKSWTDELLRDLNSRLVLQAACRRFALQLKADCPLVQNAMCSLRVGLADGLGQCERQFLASLYTGKWDAGTQAVTDDRALDFIDSCMLAAIAVSRCTPRGLKAILSHHAVDPQFICAHSRSLEKVVQQLRTTWVAAVTECDASDKASVARAVDRALKNDCTLDGALLILNHLYIGR